MLIFKGSNSPLKSPKFNYEKSKKTINSLVSEEFNSSLSLEEAKPVACFTNNYDKKTFKDLIDKDQTSLENKKSTNSKFENVLTKLQSDCIKQNILNENKKDEVCKEYLNSNSTLLPDPSFLSSLRLRNNSILTKSFSKFSHEKMLSISENLNKTNKNDENFASVEQSLERSKNNTKHQNEESTETDNIELLPCDKNVSILSVILSTLFLALIIIVFDTKVLNNSYLGAYYLSSGSFLVDNYFPLFQNFFVRQNCTKVTEECSSCERETLFSKYEDIVSVLQQNHKNQDAKLWEVIKLVVVGLPVYISRTLS